MPDGADIVSMHQPPPGAAAPGEVVDVDRLFVLIASLINLGRALETSRTEFFRAIVASSVAMNSAAAARKSGAKVIERSIVAAVRAALNQLAGLPVPEPAQWPDVAALRQELKLG